MPVYIPNIDNPLPSKNLRLDRKPELYKRAFRILTEEKKNPGLLSTIFVKINNDIKLFGAFTLNSGGSVSFFPDLYKLTEFHHITLNSDFINKKGHFTEVIKSGKHSKILYIEANKLNGNSDDYHLMTLIMKDEELLMDAPEKIEIGEIEYSYDSELNIYKKWISASISNGCYILDFPEENGYFIIQILICPKGKSNSLISNYPKPIEKNVLGSFNPPKEIIAKTLTVTTPQNCDFNIGILSFRIDQAMKNEYLLVVPTDSVKTVKSLLGNFINRFK